MGDIINIRRKDEEPEITIQEVIDKAMAAGLEGITVIGWAKDGGLFYGSTDEHSDMLWQLEQVKRILLDPDEE